MAGNVERESAPREPGLIANVEMRDGETRGRRLSRARGPILLNQLQKRLKAAQCAERAIGGELDVIAHDLQRVALVVSQALRFFMIAPFDYDSHSGAVGGRS